MKRHGGATGLRGGAHAMSARAWNRAKAAQARFRAEAFAEGQRDAQAGRAPQINRCADYYQGYEAGRTAA